jgi:hypothetical protein
MKNYGQSGVSSELEFGKNGTKLKNNASDQMQVLQNDGTSLSRMNGADPIDAQDFVTKGYLEREPDTIASGNIETGSETGSFVGQTFVVTKSGLSAPFVNITTAFDGTSPSLVVELADATVVQDSSLNDPEEIGLYQNDAYIINSTSQAVQVTVGGSAATAGAGSALVKYKK